MSSELTGWLSGIGTLLAMLGFLAVVVWAYSSKRKADFDAAARLALDDAPVGEATDSRAAPSDAPRT